MTTFLADAFVYLLIALSVGYAIWRLGPGSLRQWLGLRLRRRFPVLLRNMTISAGGCDGCSLAAKPGGKRAAAKAGPQMPIQTHRPK